MTTPATGKEGGHTKGPWALRGKLRDVVAKNDANGSPERHIADLLWHDEQGKADARLIAAAPELLAALEAINVAACYASEEDTGARAEALLHIGELARLAIPNATSGGGK